MSRLKRVIRAARERLVSEQGETLVETLVSTLIVVGVFMMLCTAIVAAARVTTSLTPEDVVLRESAAVGTDVTVTITDSSGNVIAPSGDPGYKIDGKAQNGYVFYEYTR